MIEPLQTDRKKKIMFISYFLTAINVLLVVILVLLLFVISPLTVSGDSMHDTLKDGEHIFILKVGYTIERGDIIVFEKDSATEKRIIKRVIGVEGDNIRFDSIKSCYVRNGEELNEEYINIPYSDGYLNINDANSYTALLSPQGITVEEGELFVLGDNRNISNDSHSYGCIKKDQIIGKYIFKY